MLLPYMLDEKEGPEPRGVIYPLDNLKLEIPEDNSAVPGEQGDIKYSLPRTFHTSLQISSPWTEVSQWSSRNYIFSENQKSRKRKRVNT